MRAKAKTPVLLAALVAALVAVVGGSGTAAAAGIDTCPNAELRYGAGANLPDCRAYEMVSPADKEGLTLLYGRSAGWGVGYSSTDGEHLLYGLNLPFHDPVSPGPNTVVANRTADGWISTQMSLPDCEPIPSSTGKYWRLESPANEDFSEVLYVGPQNCAPKDEGSSGGGVFGYPSEDVYLKRKGDPSPEWVSQNGQAKTGPDNALYAGNSNDGSHILFQTPEKLVMPLEEGRESGEGLFDRTGGRTVAVGLKSDGSLINPCGAYLASYRLLGLVGNIQPVSEHGRVIFFASGHSPSIPGCSTETDDAGQLYARVDASRTVEVSASQRSTPDPGGRKLPVFLGATRDGTRVYFKSAEMLTDDATEGGGLYEYDLSRVVDGSAATGTLRFLTPSSGGGPQVTALQAIRDGGEELVFNARGSIGKFPVPPGRAEHLFLLDHGKLSLLAGAFAQWGPVSVSPNGRYVLYSSEAAETLEAGETTNVHQVYLADAQGSEGGPTCISCPGGGVPALDSTIRGPMNGTGGPPGSIAEPAYVNDEGRAVFTTPNALVNRDVNETFDVYEYQAGRRQLISTGTSTVGALLLGAGSEGRDIFFSSVEPLVKQDTDNGDEDIYDARIDGGFAPPTTPVPCVGTSCQGAPGQAPGAIHPPSSSVHYHGNLSGSQPSLRTPRRVGGRGLWATIRVRVPAAGRVKVFGRTVRNTKRGVHKPRVYRLHVKLHRGPARLLRRRGIYKTTVKVLFNRHGGGRSVNRVELVFKHHRKRHRAGRTPVSDRGGQRGGS